MGRNLVETLMGAVVLAVAAIFLVFAYSRADVGEVKGYTLTAQVRPRRRRQAGRRCAHQRHQGRLGDLARSSTRTPISPRCKHQHRSVGEAAEGSRRRRS